MVPHLTTALTGPLLEREANFLTVSPELERMAPVEQVLAEEERA